MFRNCKGNGMPLRELCRSDQTLDARSAKFIGFVHQNSQNFVLKRPNAGGDAHTLNQSLLNSIAGCDAHHIEGQHDSKIVIYVLVS
ncbi:hypothetical protein [Bradyrhizobium sp.]|uniref:hypothetical protein n=1 Tax=Bradyrhizobium sp. TaxID=376 RepID=UPI0029018485|nr:hypothetical protein [Bradyrhizobium sp.]MDU3044707.1 hypothetical protein [Bradyrhizobium sp.]